MKRIGVIVPSTNTVVETDFHAAAPRDASVHSARMQIEDTTVAGERRMIEEFLPGAAADLATARPHVVAFACTSAGASMGPEAEARLVGELEQVTGAPVVSTNHAVHAELRRVGARRVAAVTPYVDELVEWIRDGIERAGFEVPVAAGMGIRDPFAICEVSEDEIVAFTDEQMRSGGCDTLFMSCTNMPAMRLRGRLGERYGVPVVTSNQATIDGVLGVLGLEPAGGEQEER